MKDIMKRDYTRCNNYGCAMKGQCKRFLQWYIDQNEQRIENFYVSISKFSPDEKTKKCKYKIALNDR